MLYGFKVYYDDKLIGEDGWWCSEREAINEAEWLVVFKIDDWTCDEIEFDEDLFDYEIITEEDDDDVDVNDEIRRWYDTVRM